MRSLVIPIPQAFETHVTRHPIGEIFVSLCHSGHLEPSRFISDSTSLTYVVTHKLYFTSLLIIRTLMDRIR